MWNVAAAAVVIKIAYACDMAWMLVVLTRSLNKLFKTNFNASCELPISVRFFAVLLRFAISRNSYKTFVARWKTDFSLCMYFHFSLAFPLTGEYFINVIFMFRSKTHSMLMLFNELRAKREQNEKQKRKNFLFCFAVGASWGKMGKLPYVLQRICDDSAEIRYTHLKDGRISCRESKRWRWIYWYNSRNRGSPKHIRWNGEPRKHKNNLNISNELI